MSTEIKFLRWLGPTPPYYVCAHEDDCATGCHGAAIRILYNRFGGKAAFEKHYTEVGMVFGPFDVPAVSFGPFTADEPYFSGNLDDGGDDSYLLGGQLTDEVRVHWTWGNSMFYQPCTRIEWWEARWLGVSQATWNVPRGYAQWQELRERLDSLEDKIDNQARYDLAKLHAP